MEQVIVTRKAYGAAIPSMGGVGGYVLQDDVTVITTHTGAVITVAGTRSTMSGWDVTEDVPAGDHDSIVSYWRAQAEGWAASAAHLATPNVVLVEDDEVAAPGFDELTFAQGLAKARKAGTMHMEPGKGCVLVTSSRSGARYAVTRTTCSCQGSASHGHCKHRAAVIACADLYGIDVHRERILGFDTEGFPVTAAGRAAQLESEVAA